MPNREKFYKLIISDAERMQELLLEQNRDQLVSLGKAFNIPAREQAKQFQEVIDIIDFLTDPKGAWKAADVPEDRAEETAKMIEAWLLNPPKNSNRININNLNRTIPSKKGAFTDQQVDDLNTIREVYVRAWQSAMKGKWPK